MSAVIHDLVQGSEEWKQHRARSLNASDLSAVMGLSSDKTRTALIAEKSSGIIPEIDKATQRRFDKGHEFEAIARPWAEEIIGSELYPVVMAADVDGLPLSASLDGIDFNNSFTFEHKSLSNGLAASLDAGVIPDKYKPQMEQGLLISGATRCLFMASSGDRETMRYAWYESDQNLRAKIVPTWRQLVEDVISYRHIEGTPPVVAASVIGLPAVAVTVSGEIDITDNFKLFEIALKDFLNNQLIRDPKDDQDFATLEDQIKVLKKAEDALDAAEAYMLAQVESVDRAKRIKEMLHDLTRQNRLMAEKIVKTHKDAIRLGLVNEARIKINEHLAAINKSLGGQYINNHTADFAGAIKGKRTITSIRDALDNELAHAKIAVNEIAEKVRANIKTLDASSFADYRFLFGDLGTIILKEPDDFGLLIGSRIDAHKKSEASKLEVERERIRKEEQEKAEMAALKAMDEALGAEWDAHAVPSYPVTKRLEATAIPLAKTTVSRARPTDAEIIGVLALHYRVHESKIIEWLLDVNFTAASERMVKSI